MELKMTRRGCPPRGASSLLRATADALDLGLVFCDEGLTVVRYCNREGRRLLRQLGAPPGGLPDRVRAALGARSADELPTHGFTVAAELVAGRASCFVRATRLTGPPAGILVLLSVEAPAEELPARLLN